MNHTNKPFYIQPEILSDGSMVYDVYANTSDHDNPVCVYNAVDKADAERVCRELNAAIGVK